MRPETGDQTIEVRRGDVARGVREIGAGPGDVVMFHSSLSSMGKVVGGPNEVIEGFLEAVGPEGLVAVPTLWWSGKEDINDWDYDNSPSYPGIITEIFRQRPDSLRSNNPTHSISAIGPRAAEFTADHGAFGLRPCRFGDQAFAVASPWEKLYQWNALYCFLGVDFTVNTMNHYCECRLLQEELERCHPEDFDRLEDQIIRWQKPGVYPTHSFQAMGEHLADLGLVAFSKIGSATLRGIRAQVMVDNILATLRAEPEKWLTEEFRAWWQEVKESEARK